MTNVLACGPLDPGAGRAGPRSPGVTLTQSELATIRAVAAGLHSNPAAQQQNRRDSLTERQWSGTTSAIGWRTSLCNSRRKRLLEREQQRQQREEEQLLQDQQEEKLRKEQQAAAIEKAKAVVLKRNEGIRAFLRAQMIADTLAGQKEQKQWATEKCALARMRAARIEQEAQDFLQRQAERERGEKEEQRAKILQAQATLKQQAQEREEQRTRERESVAAEAAATHNRLQKELQAEEEASKVKAEEVLALVEQAHILKTGILLPNFQHAPTTHFFMLGLF